MQSCITGLIIPTMLFSEDTSPLSAADAISDPGQKVSKLAPELAPRFLHFVAEKRTLAETMGKQHNLAVPTQVRDFFGAAQEQDWVGTSNLFSQLLSEVDPPAQRRLPLLLWGTIHETFGTYEMLAAWRPTFLIQCGSNIVGIQSPGRCALSHRNRWGDRTRQSSVSRSAAANQAAGEIAFSF